MVPKGVGVCNMRIKKAAPYLEPPKRTPKKPISWWCALCHRIGRSHEGRELDWAQIEHERQVISERHTARMAGLEVPEICAGDIRLSGPSMRRRLKREAAIREAQAKLDLANGEPIEV